MTEKTLPEDPTLSELFTYFEDEGPGVRVAPLTVKDDPEDTRLLMLVMGEQVTASAIFAALWETLEELSAIDKQQEANRGGSGIVTS
jgi:hypothetical protein